MKNDLHPSLWPTHVRAFQWRWALSLPFYHKDESCNARRVHLPAWFMAVFHCDYTHQLDNAVVEPEPKPATPAGHFYHSLTDCTLMLKTAQKWIEVENSDYLLNSKKGAFVMDPPALAAGYRYSRPIKGSTVYEACYQKK